MTFPDFLHSHGIIPPSEIPLDRWVDCHTLSHRKKKGRIKLIENGAVGFAIDYITMTECVVWSPDVSENDTPRERTAEENAALSRKLAQKRAEERAGIARANALYGSARALLNGDHEYFRKKHLSMCGARGIRVDEKGWLLVPMKRDGRVISVQRISPDGQKLFATGCPTKWTSYRIHRPDSVTTILCEGFATALTCFEAVPTADVIVCFSAANLIAVAEREDWQGMVAVAADNDAWTEEIHGKNPGKEAGFRAAEIIGCGCAVCPIDSDFNDLFVARLEQLQKADESAIHHASPASLRKSALVPVASEIMRAMRPVKIK